jgi:hypothetical protein
LIGTRGVKNELTQLRRFRAALAPGGRALVEYKEIIAGLRHNEQLATWQVRHRGLEYASIGDRRFQYGFNCGLK